LVDKYLGFGGNFFLQLQATSSSVRFPILPDVCTRHYISAESNLWELLCFMEPQASFFCLHQEG
jgi:hypothetical protein